jgi:hypothetical protein
MRKARLPGFIKDVSRYETQSNYQSGQADAGLAPAEDSRVVPQQQCQDSHGPCTGIWPWYRGEQCIWGRSGAEQCCTAAGTWPYIRECQAPGGGWRVSRSGCWGPCW